MWHRVVQSSARSFHMNQKMPFFLTFLIITYRRPAKLCRLLNQFLDDRWSDVMHLGLEIVVADDHSEDASREDSGKVIDALRSKGWHVSYRYREENLRGDRNLYYGYSRDSQGTYVWLLCDDDQLVVNEAIRLVAITSERQPLVCICGFAQGDLTVPANRLGSEVRVVHEFPEAVSYLGQYPKTSAYILRRIPSSDLDRLFDRWDGSLYSWIGVAIYLFGTNPGKGLMLYPPISATADEDYGGLRYSYRVFGKLYQVVRDSIESLGKRYEDVAQAIVGHAHFMDSRYQDEVLMCILGLRAHYNWRSPITYNNATLKEEVKFLRGNVIISCDTPRKFYELAKLLLIYFLASVRDILMLRQK